VVDFEIENPGFMALCRWQHIFKFNVRVQQEAQIMLGASANEIAYFICAVSRRYLSMRNLHWVLLAPHVTGLYTI
jgi:hypothetical protein